MGFVSKSKPSLMVLILFFWFGLPGHASSKNIVVITKAKLNNLPLGKNVISDLFKGKVSHWENGNRVTPIHQSDSNLIREQFNKYILNAKKDQKFYVGARKILFKTIQAKNSKKIIEIIKSLNDSVGYVYSDEVTEWAIVLL